MSGEDSTSLASKCMAFCQTLASQGQVFNFSLSIGPDFSFSLDTRSKAVKTQETKKRSSPSTLRRNARRRAEFNAKKQQSSPSRISSGENTELLPSPEKERGPTASGELQLYPNHVFFFVFYCSCLVRFGQRHERLYYIVKAWTLSILLKKLLNIDGQPLSQFW